MKGFVTLNSEILKNAEKLVSILKQKNLKIATAESCTGGMVASYITEVAGVSQVFELGVTSYTNAIKHKILNVDSETLKNYGAVSENTAKQMAENVRALAGADIGLSVTGVAGPDGQEGNPPGTVFIGISLCNSTEVNLLNIEPKNRNFVREETVRILFERVINLLI